jgi:SAM-dependent methyltransferase
LHEGSNTIAAIAGGISELGSYAIAGGEQGKRRLNLLAEIMRPSTLRLLEEAGLRDGELCLDVGCGGGHVTRDLARIAGPRGGALGIDFDPEIIGLARRDAEADGVENVEFLVADARTVERAGFALAYARFLLSHVGEPERVLAHIRDRVGPSGRVAIEDVDFGGSYCFPRDPAYDRFVELYTEAVRHGGGDANLGRRLPALMLETGLRDVRWNVFQPVHSHGSHKLMSWETMQKIRPAVLRLGLATEPEIDEILAQMWSFAKDPSTLVSMPRMVQAWGTN